MSGSFVPTGSFTNLTRLELEQLRKADFGVAGKSLTTGDASGANADVNAELFASNPAMALADIISVRPPTNPNDLLGTVTQVAQDAAGALVSSPTVRWFGPKVLLSSTGAAISSNVWQSGSPITGLGIQAGDILIVKPLVGNTSFNDYATAVVTSVLNSVSFQVGSIRNPGHSPTNQLGTGDAYKFMVIRPQVIQLYAIPGSGPPGQEQAYMFVKPVAQNSGVHALGAIDNSVLATLAPQRIKNIVPPTFAARPGDRSDAVYTAAGGSLDALGYRVIFFPDDGTGTGPDLTSPIAAVSPLIDGTIPATDQRVTIDYAAGVVRLSTPPTVSGAFKRGVNPGTSRMNLYATFWAVDSTNSAGAATSLYFARGDATTSLTPSKVVWGETEKSWLVDHGDILGNGPLDLLAGSGFAQLSSLSQFVNEESWEPLLTDPSFEFVPQISSTVQPYPGPWVYSPSESSGYWKTAAGNASGTALRILSSGTGAIEYSVKQVQPVPVRPGQKLRFKVDYRPVGTPTTSTDLTFRVQTQNATFSSLSTQFVPLQTLSTSSGTFLRLEGILTVLAGKSWITEVQLAVIQNSGPGGSTPIFDIDNFQVYLEPLSSQDAHGIRPRVTSPIVKSLKFTNDPTADGTPFNGKDATLTYDISTSKVRLGRFDNIDTVSNTPPSFEQRGDLTVGAGLFDSAVSRVNLSLADVASNYSNIAETRTLLSQTKAPGDSFAIRQYAAKPVTGAVTVASTSGTTIENTTNLSWDKTKARWIRDSGSSGDLGTAHVVDSGGARVLRTNPSDPVPAEYGDASNYGVSAAFTQYTGRFVRQGQQANWTTGGTVLTLDSGYPSLLQYPMVRPGDILYTHGPVSTDNFRYYVTNVTATTITIGAAPGGLSSVLPNATFQDTGLATSGHFIDVAPAYFLNDRSTNLNFQELTIDSLVTLTTTSKFTSTNGYEVTVTGAQEGDRIDSIGVVRQDILGAGSSSLQQILSSFRYQYRLNGTTTTIDAGDASGTLAYETGITAPSDKRLILDTTIRATLVVTKAMEVAGRIVISIYTYTNTGGSLAQFAVRNHSHTLVRQV